MESLKKVIREVPDFPKQGILFYDITTLLEDPEAFGRTIDHLAERYADKEVDCFVAIDARGFVFGSVLAYKLKKGLVLVRKKGKLPYKTRSAEYSLEYGTDTVEMHEGAVKPGQKVVVVDDLLATGGTAEATARLVGDSGGEIVECCFVIELTFLEGRKRLGDTPIYSVLQYDK